MVTATRQGCLSGESGGANTAPVTNGEAVIRSRCRVECFGGCGPWLAPVDAVVAPTGVVPPALTTTSARPYDVASSDAASRAPIGCLKRGCPGHGVSWVRGGGEMG